MPLVLWSSSQKIGEECSSAGAHGGGVMRGEFLQLPQGGEATFGDQRREVGQRLHGEGLHDATGVAKIFCEDVIDPVLFGCIPPKARQHLGDVPAHFFLITACEPAHECGSVGTQPFRVDR